MGLMSGPRLLRGRAFALFGASRNGR